MRTTEEELRKLEAENLELGSELWTTHFFSHFGSSDAERSRFRDELQAAGFGTRGKFAEVGTDEEWVEGTGYWHHWTFSLFEADPEVLREADERAQAIASTNGVRYDGWQVQRHPPFESGPPRLADYDE